MIVFCGCFVILLWVVIMGYVKVKVKVRSIQPPKKEAELQLLAHTGAIYTIISSNQLKNLGVKPTGKRSFKTADGRVIQRQVGIAEIQIKDQITHSIIVFGEKEDIQVLGVTTLEELGLQVDPVTGELKPLELLLLHLSSR